MSRRTPGFVAVNLAAAVALASVLGMSVGPRLSRMRERAATSMVRASCHTTQIAAEAYAQDHWGIYAPTVANFVAYLPDGLLLRNPFTDAVTEPVDGAAGSPGQVGYVVFADPGGFNSGYTITGFGRTQQIVTLSNFEW